VTSQLTLNTKFAYGIGQLAEGLSEFNLFLWLTVTILLTRLAMTLYHVPHIALGAELSTDYQERSQIVSFRYVFGFVGYFISYGLGFAWFFRDTAEFPNGQFNVAAYEPYSIALAILMVVTIVWSGVGTHHRIPYLPRPGGEEVKLSLWGIVVRMLGEIWGALNNHSFRWLFAGALIIFIMVGIDGALNLYIFEYFWELDSRAKLYVLLLYPVGIILGSMVSPITHRRINKRTGVIIGAAGWASVQIIPILLRFVGWFPENGTDELVITLVALKILQGFLTAQSLISWPRGAHIQSAADIPVETLGWLGLIYGPIVAGCAVFNVLFNLQCKMTRQDHERVVKELDVLRARRDTA